MTIEWIPRRSNPFQRPWYLQSRDKRFIITETTDGYSLVDKRTGEMLRFATLVAAKAVADVRQEAEHGQ